MTTKVRSTKIVYVSVLRAFVAKMRKVNASRAFREANLVETLNAVAQQRTAEVNGAEKLINNWIPNSTEETKPLGDNVLILRTIS